MTPIGVMISPLIALINHSCAPNVAVVVPRGTSPTSPAREPIIKVVALRPILPCEEVRGGFSHAPTDTNWY